MAERTTKHISWKNSTFQQLSVSQESHICFRFSHYYCLEADAYS